MIRPPPISPLFPYTTLFRSCRPGCTASPCAWPGKRAAPPSAGVGTNSKRRKRRPPIHPPTCRCARRADARSEEHTSELQSHVNLVCRLLLEKKKKNKKHTTH